MPYFSPTPKFLSQEVYICLAGLWACGFRALSRPANTYLKQLFLLRLLDDNFAPADAILNAAGERSAGGYDSCVAHRNSTSPDGDDRKQTFWIGMSRNVGL
jgi:hypothetical protein